VVKYLDWGPNSEQDTRDFIQKTVSSGKSDPRTEYNLVLINNSNHRLIGACHILIKSAVHREGEIGYVLNYNYWNQGFMTEAMRQVVSFGFKGLGLHRISATCDTGNTGSYRVMEKIGMQREGILRDYRLIQGVWRDCFVYSILENEWGN
jgi:RimJ/RimL family protein N-acetyltransferase